ncbi:MULTISPECIES: AAA family ATPase [Nostocales]|uniref:AAA family ATPase n=1 Tax=Dolichospermum flos-aquae UHCC 0037 TaxID=2590026 RepID=A0ACC7S273_DOLFA|nr:MULTISPECIES: AAA family ATPase [Nostocales]MBO1064281.1 AAA family ATPase [Anabaena sp. 54]MTJ42126.1 AAA family ATPase [Dolichospermum flos-aquae UHCC 0037]
MKIKFSNLGSIQETELDLRPLTVIIGPNNSGKTYIAYSTYGLWQRAGTNINSTNITSDQLGIEQKGEGLWSLKIDNKLLDFFIRESEEMSRVFKGEILKSFFQDSSGKLFYQTSFEMIISRQEVKNAINKLIQEEYLHLADTTYYKISYQDDILCFELQSRDLAKTEQNNLNISEFMRAFKHKPDVIFILNIKRKLFGSSYPFPAERNAFINTYKILQNRRYELLKKNKRELFSNSNSVKQLSLFDVLKDQTDQDDIRYSQAVEDLEDFLNLLSESDQDDVRYPQPVEDFLHLLSEIELQTIPKINSNNKNEFQKLADEIEKQLQNKNKTNLKPTKLGGKEIKVLVKKGLEIDLYNASSSIRQLAPLLLYLRYRASKGDFLVIDEPEMNLHPESQAKLLEALSILVNLGVRILLTTHSPYIMAHLDNLVNGNHENPEILKRQCSYLYLQDERAFLPIDQVSAYEMKDNKLVSLHDPDYGIRWDTLSDVSVDIQQKFFQIYEAGQEKADETEE